MNNDLELVAEQFRKLPGIGVKTARRLAYFMLERPQSDVDAFIQTIRDARSKVCYCSACYNLSTSDPCEICNDDRRDHSLIDQLKIKELLNRISNHQVQEIILATDPDTEGEATAYYISHLIKPLGIKVTRIARGLPAGGDIGYADSMTLAGAVENRKEM